MLARPTAMPVLLAGLATVAALAMLAGAAAAAQPATAPADATMDWLLNQATTAPSPRHDEAPATQPASPFAPRDDRGARKAVILLSNGERIPGPIATTRDKPIRVWDEKDKEYRDIPFDLIKQFDAEILWERDQPEWAFKESGSDIKVFTGKTYHAREMKYRLTLVNGQTVTGGVVAPLYLVTREGDRIFLLNKRQKGDVGQTLKQLAYVKQVVFE